MNPKHFEYNSEYLAHIAYCTFTNKYYEFVLNYPDQSDEVYNKDMISALHAADNRKIKMFCNINYTKINSESQLNIDTSKMKLWKEFFGRFPDIEESMKTTENFRKVMKKDFGNNYLNSHELDQILVEGQDKRELCKTIVEMNEELQQMD